MTLSPPRHRAARPRPARKSPGRRPIIEPLEGRSLLSSNLTHFPLPDTGGTLHDFFEGPDGTFWFAADQLVGGDDSITATYVTTLLGKVTPKGKVTLFPTGGDIRFAGGFMPLADGTLWFDGADKRSRLIIGEITPANKLRIFHPPADPTAAPASPFSLGSADDFWYYDDPSPVSFGEAPASRVRIVRVSPRGTVQDFHVPAELPGGQEGLTVHINTWSGSRPELIRAPDGALWFEETIYGADTSQEAFVRISPTGRTREFPIPAADADPLSISGQFTFSRDGSLWFAGGTFDFEAGGLSPEIVRMSPSGRFSVVASHTYSVPLYWGDPIADSEGNIWFAGAGPGYFAVGPMDITLVRANAAGHLDAFPITIGEAVGALALSPGPNGSMDFVGDTQSVGRVSRSGRVSSINVDAVPDPDPSIPWGDTLFNSNSNPYRDYYEPLIGPNGSVLVAPNGDLWFVASTDGQITRFRPPTRGAPR